MEKFEVVGAFLVSGTTTSKGELYRAQVELQRANQNKNAASFESVGSCGDFLSLLIANQCGEEIQRS